MRTHLTSLLGMLAIRTQDSRCPLAPSPISCPKSPDEHYPIILVFVVDQVTVGRGVPEFQSSVPFLTFAFQPFAILADTLGIRIWGGSHKQSSADALHRTEG